MKIKIREGLEIGDGLKPFIIAEVGSNWDSFEDCTKSIAVAKNCGADAVKFQLFDHEALFGLSREERKLIKGMLPVEWLPKLKAKADAFGIEFMCSAFSPALVDAVDPYVNIHKVASAEMSHKRILEKLRAKGKPVILSTGAHNKTDIGISLDCLGDTPVVLMYCVAAYPARSIDYRVIGELKSTFNKLVGISDHSVDYAQVKSMLEYEPCVIEKHVNFVDAKGDDAPHSLSTGEFQQMIKGLRGEISPSIGPTAEEKPMVLRHNRRLIAIKDIKAGERLVEGMNFGIFRSLKDDTRAFHPFKVDLVDGKVALKDIAAGDGVGPGDV
jgi:N,N'-diacetyllegionaminate synthase